MTKDLKFSIHNLCAIATWTSERSSLARELGEEVDKRLNSLKGDPVNIWFKNVSMSKVVIAIASLLKFLSSV